MKPTMTQIIQRQYSHNPESQKQEQNNLTQNEQFLNSIIKLQKEIEELQHNQQTVSESLTNNLNNINNKIDSMESLINELSCQPLNSTIEFLKQSNTMLKKSQTQNKLNMNSTQIADFIMDQKYKNQEQKSSLNRVNSHQPIQANKIKIINQIQFNKSDPNNQQKQNIKNDQGVKQNQLKIKQCVFCQEKDYQLIETPCYHFFHKKCLKQLYDQQLINYEHKKSFNCTCQQELHSKLFLRNLQIDNQIVFQKQLNIIYQNHKNKIKQCINCKIIWIFDLYQKTNELCFKCGQIQKF